MINGLSELSMLQNAKSRSISAENFTGEKGKGGMAVSGTGADCARDLGQKWKISPSIHIAAGTTFTLCDIHECGAITHIWITSNAKRPRDLILRMYWDENENPSVEVPYGDFFCDPAGNLFINSLAVCVNPTKANNCYWYMPFLKNARITLENQGTENITVYYQIDYTITEIDEPCAYFHAQFRRQNPLPYKEDYTILDGVSGKGQYIGTQILWVSNNNGWWGEGEIKFFLDGDDEFPTICGTGTEDYFCGAWCFEKDGEYKNFSTAYSGFAQLPSDRMWNTQNRFSMYRWHITDPIRFEENLKVTIQAIGWRRDKRYLPLQDDISSVAYWYQTMPSNKFPKLPDKDYLEFL